MYVQPAKSLVEGLRSSKLVGHHTLSLRKHACGDQTAPWGSACSVGTCSTGLFAFLRLCDSYGTELSTFSLHVTSVPQIYTTHTCEKGVISMLLDLKTLDRKFDS